jgi:hypothetical protein
MTQHLNFYENIKEARMRLRNTVVMYENEPYYVLAITDHKGPVFRIYLNPLEHIAAPNYGLTDITQNIPVDYPGFGDKLDTWMASNPSTKVIRKRMDSKHFNNFRPFPLGMCNYGEKCYYVERQPQRKSEQGLTKNSTQEHLVTTALKGDNPIQMGGIRIWDKQFADCILGKYPTAKECLDNLLDNDIANEAVAFSRDFALCRGPIDMLFLAYKTDIVGVLPNRDFSLLRLGKEFNHVKEVAGDLRLFTNIH